MRNRWFHRPRLHLPVHGHGKKVTWLELFFDLVFVAAFIQLGNGLSANVTVEGFASFAAVFTVLWIVWTGFTFFENRFALDDFAHRVVVLFQMFTVGAMAISAADVLEGDPRWFSISAGVAQLVVAAMYLRTIPQVDEARPYARYWGIVFAIGGLAWIVATFLPPVAMYALWAIGSVLIVGAPLSPASRRLDERFPSDEEHLFERYGLFTLIVLGESFVKVLSSLVREDHAGSGVWIAAAIALLITCTIWWIYFDDVAGAPLKKGRGLFFAWLYGHIPLQMGITAVGVAASKAMHFTFEAPADAKYRWLLAGSIALVFLSVAAIDSVTERKQAELSDRVRVTARAISGVVLLVLAPAGDGMSGAVFLGLITAICAGQVIIDMMIAPFEEAEHIEVGHRTVADLAREKLAGATGRTSLRPPSRFGEAVRKGTPTALRRDLYFFFMEGSWTRLFAGMGIFYLLINLFFAALYMLEPGAIAEADPESFLDAFFFSVQTMATIGYGAMHPATTYGHIVVTVEAAVGLLSVALATGLMFAKASRARASVLFSEPIVLTTMHGKPTLSFRVGNARGNEVVDASASVSVLRDEISPEGHHVRRVLDLELVRNRQPIFMMTWTILHVIDEKSPLYGVDLRATDPFIGVVAILSGHDGTYGQTVHARHFYRPEDLRVDHRFVDVISQLEDGRMMIDYTRFHDTTAEQRTSLPEEAADEEAVGEAVAGAEPEVSAEAES